MPRTIHKTEEPVTLEGYQAVMKPSKFGYSLSAVVDSTVADTLDEERSAFQPWWDSKLKNPKRSVQKPEPWEEVAEGQFKIKFSWNEERRPPIVDTGDMSATAAAELFGKTEGFKAPDPSVTPNMADNDF